MRGEDGLELAQAGSFVAEAVALPMPSISIAEQTRPRLCVCGADVD